MRTPALERAMGPAKSQRPPVGKIALWYRCLRKLPYSAKGGVKEAVMRNKRLKANERPYNAYRCAHCFQYHVGHATPEQQARELVR